jgi:uncharacterized membrane protein
MSCIWRFCAVLAFGMAALQSAPAEAALTVCDQTSYILYTAAGYQAGPNMFTRGWTRIVPGDCTSVLPDPLTAPTYYLHAKSAQAHSGPARAWGGAIRLCAKDANFSLQSPITVPGCQGDDTFQLPFAAVATHGRKSWTTTLTESPLIASLDVARLAGIERLLNDIGYHVGPDDANGNKSRDDAMIDFRKRMKLPETASNADLYAALETAALKASAPAGYSVCNDTDGDVWAAIGLKSGTSWVARGWWKVPPAGCAKAITDPLATDKVYLLVENHINNAYLVKGPMKFCITNIEFEVFGIGKCASRGLTEVGFAETDTGGRTGYAAHVGKNGLLAPAKATVNQRMPK